MTEFSLKQDRIRELLEAQALDAMILQRSGSFSWATCGAADYVNAASSFGAATLLVTGKRHYLISDNIEAPRLENEEKLKYQGWEFQVHPWYSETSPLENLIKGLKVGADSPYPGAKDLTNEIARIRMNMTPEEGVRFRVLGRLCAELTYQDIRETLTDLHSYLDNMELRINDIGDAIAQSYFVLSVVPPPNTPGRYHEVQQQQQ